MSVAPTAANSTALDPPTPDPELIPAPPAPVIVNPVVPFSNPPLVTIFCAAVVEANEVVAMRAAHAMLVHKTAFFKLIMIDTPIVQV